MELPCTSIIHLLVDIWPSGVHSNLSYLLGAAFGLTGLYVVGHAIAALSSLIVDRILNARVIGYPFQNLILGCPSRKSPTLTAKLWVLIFSAVNLGAIVLASLSWATPPGTAAWAVWVSAGIVTVLVAIKLLARTATNATGWRQSLLATCLDASKPLFLILNWIKTFIHQGRGIGGDNGLIGQAIRDHLKAKYDLPSPSSDSDPTTHSDYTNLYWFPALQVSLTMPAQNTTLMHWLRMYGFARNTSVAFWLSAMYASVLPLVISSGLPGAAPHGSLRILSLTLGLFAVSVVMLFRYYYMYYAYYSKYVFRCYYHHIITEREKTRPEQNSGHNNINPPTNKRVTYQ